MTADLESTTSSDSSPTEKLWSLRRKRVSVPTDNIQSTCKADGAQVENKPLRQKRVDVNDTSAKHVIERILYLLERFDKTDFNNPKRLGMVGVFRRANYLLESVHKASSVQDVKQQDTSTSLRDVLLVAESRLESLLSRLFEPLGSENRHEDDPLTSDPWAASEDVATEDLLEFFFDSLEADISKTTKTIMKKTAVGDLLNVCWQQEEWLKTSAIETDVRTPRPVSILADLEKISSDGFFGSDNKFEKRGSAGTASTASRFSAVSSVSISILSARSSVESQGVGLDALTLAKGSGGVNKLKQVIAPAETRQSSPSQVPTLDVPTLTKEPVGPASARGVGKLKQVIEIEERDMNLAHSLALEHMV
jgi:hypothetical protein